MSQRNFNKSFSQARKGEAQTVTPQARQALADMYGVDSQNVISVETEKEGKYDPNEMDSTKLLDYNGIDWPVRKGDLTIPVGQRIRNGTNRDMTLRVKNGTGNTSEAQSIPEGIKKCGLYPRDYLLGMRESFDLHKAYLIDTRKLLSWVDRGKITQEYRENDDGSAYYKYDLLEVKTAGCITEVWSK